LNISSRSILAAGIVPRGMSSSAKRADVSAWLPIRVVSEANMHQHWRRRQLRAKSQRAITCVYVGRLLRGAGKPKRVVLTRYSARELDSDNLAGAFKHVRDEIAALCGFNDREKSVEWVYQQFKADPRIGAGCRVKVEF
jgi:hypothetical protein